MDDKHSRSSALPTIAANSSMRSDENVERDLSNAHSIQKPAPAAIRSGAFDEEERTALCAFNETSGESLNSSLDSCKAAQKIDITDPKAPLQGFKEPGFLSKITFAWFTPLAIFGFRNEISRKHLFPLDPSLDAGTVTARFQQAWDAEEASVIAGRSKRTFALGRAIARIGMGKFMAGFGYDLLAEICSQSIPLIINQLLQEMELDENENRVVTSNMLGYRMLLCFGLSLLQFMHALFMNRSVWITHANGLRTKIGLTGLIFDKMLTLTPEARHDYSMGRAVALVSTSISRIDTAYPYLHYIWFGPMQVIILLVMINFMLGPKIGMWIVLLLVVALPLQTLIMHRMNILKKRIAHMTDRRLRFLQETIMGIRVVKCYAWESIFFDRLASYRAEELNAIFRWRMFATWSIVLNVAVPALSAVIGYFLLAYTGNGKILSSTVFAVLTYFNMLDLPLSNMPIMTTLCVDAYAALRRIEDFMRADSMKPLPDVVQGAPEAIVFDAASFTWMPRADKRASQRASASIGIEKDDASPEQAATPLPMGMPTPVVQMLADKRTNEFSTEVIEGRAPDARTDADETLSTASLDQKIISPSQLVASSPAVVFDSQAGQSAWLPMQPAALEFSAAHADHSAGDPFGADGGDDVPIVSRGLENLSLRIPHGSLVAIVGPVGAGKSSLLSAIYGEMERSEGSFNVNGTIAYCPQQAWIINANVRQNILLGQPFIAERYWRTIRECQMEDDLAALPFGDLTAIGEGGISLSGGQKARLNLARMVYFDCDICLMDDPLSAVDYRVGKAIVEECLLGVSSASASSTQISRSAAIDGGIATPVAPSAGKGLLSGKTRVLVTHHLGVLPHCDHIVVMDGGRIVEKGTYTELLSRTSLFTELLACYHAQHRTERSEAGTMSGCESPTPLASPVMSNVSSADDAAEAAPRPVRTAAARRKSVTREPISVEKMTSTEEDVERAAWRAEELQAQTVRMSIYGFYMAVCGGAAFTVLLMLSIGFNEILRTGRDFWLKWWVEEEDGLGLDLNLNQFRNLYVVLAVVQTSATWICGYLFIKGSYRASRALHDQALARVIGSPLRFFDTTPVGRIINRFGRDIDMIDVQVSDDVWYMLFALGSMSSTLMLIFYYEFRAGIAILFPIVLALMLQAIYRANARQLHRLYAKHFSPLMANFSETYLGLSIARAFGHEAFFRRRHEAATNVAAQCSIASYALRRWTSMNCEFITALLLGSAGAACVYFQASSEVAGIIISSLVNFVFSLDWFIKQSAELEASMVSVERLHQYATELEVEEGADDGQGGKGKPAVRVVLDAADMECEDGYCDEKSAGSSPFVAEHAPALDADSAELTNWPARGRVEFRGLYLCYRKGTRPVLSNLSLAIRAGERIGIVGRTGAGKSSIMTALMRTVEWSAGSILIDGLDISRVPLSVLRSRVTIVPQDPIMFAGTLAFNIDPRGVASDADMWHALDKVGLRETVRRLRGKLQFEVCDLGENFSLGQRQLFCLARALLCRSRIVLMDEATASMDVETDAKIQRSLRDNFGGCTIITIAHRLGTVRDYDRIVVLDAGCVVEVDTPDALLADPSSRLSALFRSSLKSEEAAMAHDE